MTTRTPVNVEHNSQLSTSAKSIYTTSTEKLIVRKLSFFNTSASDYRKVSVHLVESGGSVSTSNILDERSIPPRKPWNCIAAQGEVLEGGISLQVLQDSGADVNVNSSGTVAT